MIGYVGSVSSDGGPGAEISLAFGWMAQLDQPSRKDIRNWLSGTSWTLSAFNKLGGGIVVSKQYPYAAVIGGFGIGGKAFTEAHTKSSDDWVRSIRSFFDF